MKSERWHSVETAPNQSVLHGTDGEPDLSVGGMPGKGRVAQASMLMACIPQNLHVPSSLVTFPNLEA